MLSKNRADIETTVIFLSIKRRSKLAVLVNDGDTDTWLPLSQIIIGTENRYNEADIEMPVWLAEKNGLV